MFRQGREARRSEVGDDLARLCAMKTNDMKCKYQRWVPSRKTKTPAIDSVIVCDLITVVECQCDYVGRENVCLRCGALLETEVLNRCRGWFADHRIERQHQHMLHDLFLIHDDLSYRAIPRHSSVPPSTRREMEQHEKRISHVEKHLRQHPDLTKQLRPDLERLWRCYRTA